MWADKWCDKCEIEGLGPVGFQSGCCRLHIFLFFSSPMISQQPDGAVQDRFDLGNGSSLILVTLLFGLNFILFLVTEKAVEKRRE